ncbi:hypothetical protein Xmau_03806 [Xenorhabdus mauleonii]|uniref:Restriction endonuclease fold toxin 5 n=1 Tax=Xenorhabdus mauleonii TaxID=351675 RepID=A0A1I3V0Y5_9GAMM|nr:Tox-REase-5 domain-containing protein [Xenorhabdus mauleonii]PHM37589.1 hypothetical protein Xmau_03806 [Xenorhabdus mauleonii]SFJ89078.1 Restriction endonuclease fold toxin 5 [Xenorhabdus mauleonii]
MPIPLVLAGPALLAAAEYTLTALAGIAIGTGVAVGINEATKDKSDEQDKAKSETEAITTSRTKCKECPAIGSVIPYWESASISAISTIYQIQICNSAYNEITHQLEVWRCGAASFDGWKPKQCLFLEAKGKHEQFFEDGEPKHWWKGGHTSMMSQAARQQGECTKFEGIPKSHWHFMELVTSSYFSKAFSGFPNITVFHTPFFE